MAFFVAFIYKIPLFIVKFVWDAPFIPFLAFPKTVNFPSPLIVREDELLNFIPAPSKSSSSSFDDNSLSNI